MLGIQMVAENGETLQFLLVAESPNIVLSKIEHFSNPEDEPSYLNWQISIISITDEGSWEEVDKSLKETGKRLANWDLIYDGQKYNLTV